MNTLLYFLLFGALFFFMMRFGCGAHVMGHGHGHSRSGDTGEARRETPRWTPPSEDRDPVCGMTVKPERAKSSVFDGTVYYFCSEKCRLKFEEGPEQYLSQRAAQPLMETSHDH